MLRWLFLLRYPDQITAEEGERWYLGTHTQEAKHLKNLESYKTWRGLALPDELRPGTAEERRRTPWYRVTELGFKDFAAWKEGQDQRREQQLARGEPVWTPPPYGWPGFISETIFIGDEPEYDFLKESPRVP
jgi:hypothetical protein